MLLLPRESDGRRITSSAWSTSSFREGGAAAVEVLWKPLLDDNDRIPLVHSKTCLSSFKFKGNQCFGRAASIFKVVITIVVGLIGAWSRRSLGSFGLASMFPPILSLLLFPANKSSSRHNRNQYIKYILTDSNVAT